MQPVTQFQTMCIRCEERELFKQEESEKDAIEITPIFCRKCGDELKKKVEEIKNNISENFFYVAV